MWQNIPDQTELSVATDGRYPDIQKDIHSHSSMNCISCPEALTATEQQLSGTLGIAAESLLRKLCRLDKHRFAESRNMERESG